MIILKLNEITNSFDDIINEYNKAIEKIRQSDFNNFEITDKSDENGYYFICNLENEFFMSIKANAGIEYSFKEDFYTFMNIYKISDDIQIKFFDAYELDYDLCKMTIKKILKSNKLRIKY